MLYTRNIKIGDIAFDTLLEGTSNKEQRDFIVDKFSRSCKRMVLLFVWYKSALQFMHVLVDCCDKYSIVGYVNYFVTCSSIDVAQQF
jgi:hypothetical protein